MLATWLHPTLSGIPERLRKTCCCAYGNRRPQAPFERSRYSKKLSMQFVQIAAPGELGDDFSCEDLGRRYGQEDEAAASLQRVLFELHLSPSFRPAAICLLWETGLTTDNSKVKRGDSQHEAHSQQRRRGWGLLSGRCARVDGHRCKSRKDEDEDNLDEVEEDIGGEEEAEEETEEAPAQT